MAKKVVEVVAPAGRTAADVTPEAIRRLVQQINKQFQSLQQQINDLRARS